MLTTISIEINFYLHKLIYLIRVYYITNNYVEYTIKYLNFKTLLSNSNGNLYFLMDTETSFKLT
jgi:hypothetical protein